MKEKKNKDSKEKKQKTQKNSGCLELGIISDRVIDLIFNTSPTYEVDEEYLNTTVF